MDKLSRRSSHCITFNTLLLLPGIVFIIFVSVANALGTIPQGVFYSFAILGVIASRKIFIPLDILLLFFLCAFIVSFQIINHSGTLNYLLSLVRPFVESCIIANLLYFMFRINDTQKIIGVIKLFIVFQFLMFVVMLLFPEIRTNIISYIYQGPEYAIPAFKDALEFRGFGISKHHLYGLPLALAVICTIVLYQDNENFWHKIIFIGLASIIILVNARIGLVSVILSMMLFSVTLRYKDIRFLIGVIALAFALLTVFYIVSLWLNIEKFPIVEWLKAGVEQFSQNDQSSTTINDLRSMIHFPDSPLGILLGNGVICPANSNCYSDIGAIRLVNFAGLILLFLVIVIYWRFCASILLLENVNDGNERFRCHRQKILQITLFMIFILGLIKGDAYFSSDYCRLLILLSILTALIKRNSNETVSD
ncbi:hypothetical protein [Kluyvera ascorbata]|uniref:hypothetical protein n=1 Tax=Kluyvera ascorbata TaxID=51288 RepID=UPI0039F5EFD6